MTDAERLAELEHYLVQRGAALVGCADLGSVNAEVRKNLPRGVAIGAALAPEIVAGIAAGPTDAYSREYERANALLDQLSETGAAFLRERGHRAVAMPATVTDLDKENLTTPLPHKTIATLAGLGWIGKCALLITESHGSAVRYATILTDAPLPVGEPVTGSRCGSCQACVEACPVGAPSGRPWQQGLSRPDIYDAFACFRGVRAQAAKLSPDCRNLICGICIAACPYTKLYMAGRP